MSSQALSSYLRLFLSGYSLSGASGQCPEMGPALGDLLWVCRRDGQVESGFSGTWWVREWLCWPRLILQSEQLISRTKLFLQLEASSFILLDAKEQSEHRGTALNAPLEDEGTAGAVMQQKCCWEGCVYLQEHKTL